MAGAETPKSITCPDGAARVAIDLKAISIRYEAASFAATLGSLAVLSVRLNVEPKTLQQAAATTQQWNEFLKGLVAGYNSCIISKESYEEGLTRIYPRLKDDAADIERLRKLIEAGRQADEKRLKNLLDSYLANFRRFAEVSARDGLFERISTYVDDQLAKVENRANKRIDEGLEQVNERLAALVTRVDQLQLARPNEVQSELKTSLLAAAEETERAYRTGYDLMQRYRFEDAIPHFRRASALVSLPEIHLALGNALLLSGSDILERPKRTEADRQRAERLLEEARTELLKSAAAYPRDDRRRAERARVYLGLGLVLHGQGKSQDLLRQAADYNRQALALLDCKQLPDECIQGYVNLFAALEWMPTQHQQEREDNLEAAMKALESAEPLVVEQQWDSLRRAFFDRNLAVAIGHRFRGGREQNVRRGIELSQRALDALTDHEDRPAGTYVLVLNHLGTLYMRLAEGDRLAHLRQAGEAFEKARSIVGPDYFPEYDALLRDNLKLLEDLVARGGALPDDEVIGRFGIEIQDLKDDGRIREAIEATWRLRHWAGERFGTLHLRVAMAHNTLGTLYVEGRSLDAAAANLYCALALLHKTLPPDHPLSYLHEEVQRNYLRTLSFLGQNAAIWPPPGRASLAVDDAVRQYERALSLYVSDRTAALAALDEALRAFPCYPKALANRANVKMQLGDYAGAFDDATAALVLDPRDTVALFHRAQLLMGAGRWSDAIEDLDTALKVDAGILDAYEQRAISHEAAGHRELAVRDWRSVLVKSRSGESRDRAQRKLRELENTLQAQ